MISLFTTYYSEKNLQRKKEIDFCLETNRANSYIERIYLFNESIERFNDPKIITVQISKRPCFNNFFDLINSVTDDDGINIISNSDIYFDDSLKYVLEYNKKKALALTRWNTAGKPTLQSTFFYSQDTWVFFGKVNNVKADFQIGSVGGDNRLAYEIKVAGYKVSNPALTIKTYHFHTDTFRNSYPSDFAGRVPSPYYYPMPVISIYDKRMLNPAKIFLQVIVLIYWIKQFVFGRLISQYKLVRRSVIESFKKISPRMFYYLKKILINHK